MTDMSVCSNSLGCLVQPILVRRVCILVPELKMKNSRLIPLLRILLFAAGIAAVTSLCRFDGLTKRKPSNGVYYGLVRCALNISNVWDDYSDWVKKTENESERNDSERISHKLYIDIAFIPLSTGDLFKNLTYFTGEDIKQIVVHNVTMDRIDPVICMLKSTTAFFLSGNRILKFDLRQTLKHLVSAEKINMSENAINTLEETEDTSYFRQDALQELDLSHNVIEIVPKHYFKGVDNLRALDLSHNAIMSLNAESFEGLVNLKKLSLSNNKLTHVGSYAGRLHELKLDFNNLVSLDGMKLNTNFTLLKLIPSNDDEKFVGSLLQYTPALSKLDISHNKISTISKSEFYTFANNLTNIDLAYNNIMFVECGTFDGKNVDVKNEGNVITNMFNRC